MPEKMPDTSENSSDDRPRSQDSPSTELVLYHPTASAAEPATQPNFFQRLAYAFRPQANASIRNDLQLALESGMLVDQTISPAERAMLGNILRLREVRVADVMVPRAEMQAVDVSTSLGELLQIFEASGHSRMPVYHENLDDPHGMVHIRDAVGYVVNASRKKRRGRAKTDRTTKAGNGNAQTPFEQLDLAGIDLSRSILDLKLTREVLFVPPSMLASDLMARMQASRIQMALVIDEYGGTDGLVSLEDIVEMVVGDIEDEHDDIEVRIQPLEDGSFLVDARVEIEELAAHLGRKFLEAANAEDDEVDTLGGLIFSLLGRVPVRGEVIPHFADFEIEIRDADPRRIRTALLKPVKAGGRRRQSRKEAIAAPAEDQ